MRRLSCFVLTVVILICILVPELSALSYSGSSSYKSGKYYTQLARVNLTGNQRNDIVAVANSQIGYREGNSSSQLSGTYDGTGNYTEYGRWYGLQSLWCAMYVSWAAAVAGVSTNVVPKHSYTVSGLNFFKNQGRAYSRAQVAVGHHTPQPGDIVYFKGSRNTAATNHVGIVTGCSNGTLHTVEGNTRSSSYSSNGGVVAPHTYAISNTYIVYVCKPNYSGSGSSAPAQQTSVAIHEFFKRWVFDADYYAASNPDLKAAYGNDEAKLFKHFQENGVREGRAGSAFFDVKYYVNNNADLKAAFGTDYVAAFNHFLGDGKRENRKYSAVLDDLRKIIFDAGVYFARNADLQKEFGFHEGALFEHFMRTGLYEGRVASPFFDVKHYVTANEDLKAAFGNDYWAAFNHFASAGYTSQHKASPVVDAVYYTERYDDIKGWSTVEAARHYKNYGAREGRRASEEFNSVFYVANNPDVAQLHDRSTACYHYVGYGIPEGRAGNDRVFLTSVGGYLGTNFMAKISFVEAGKNFTVLDNGSVVNVVLASPSSAQAQKWNFIRQADGGYKIKNMKNGYVLTAGSEAGEANVVLDMDKGTAMQRWFIYQYNGRYIVRSASTTDMVLDVPGASSADNTKIQTYLANYTIAQCFEITKIKY